MERNKIYPFAEVKDIQRGALYTIPLPIDGHPMSNGFSHLSDGSYPNSTKNSPLSSNDRGYDPEDTEQDSRVYTEVNLKDDAADSNQAAAKSERKEKDLSRFVPSPSHMLYMTRI